MRFKWLAIGLAVVIGLSLLFAYRCAMGTRWSRSIGGDWEIENWKSGLPESGLGSDTLYRRKDGKRLLVDIALRGYRFYGDDCVVYATSRGKENRRYYGVCGDRVPVLLATADTDEWEMDEVGLQKMEWVGKGDNAKKRPTTRMASDEIKRRAIAQPRFREDWWKDPQLQNPLQKQR